MENSKYRNLELIEVLGTNVVKGNGKQEKDETFKEKATRNWLDLPSDIMINILQRINVIGLVQSVQKVCTYWRQICKDPCMWRVIYLDNKIYSEHRLNCGLQYEYYGYSYSPSDLQKICKNVVDRSQGQLINITMKGFCDDKLLQYVAERSSQLRRLEIAWGMSFIYYLPKALKKFPLLEELNLRHTKIQKQAIQTLGRDCPMLKTLKLNHQSGLKNDVLGLAIAENLPGLRHLHLKWCNLTDTGLRAILDRCRHLHVLDLQMCYPIIDPTGELGKRCLQQIKCVKF